MTFSPVRRAAVLLTTLAATGVGLCVPQAGAAQTPEALPGPGAVRAPATTDLTFTVPGCPRCRITLHQYVVGENGYWESKDKRARNGKVSFTVPTARTHGLDATIMGPWERHGTPTGYVTQIVFRYGGEQPGSTVSYRDARTKSRGSACWAGTEAEDVTIPVEVREVTVPGTTGPAQGTVAWTGTTQDSWKPMERTYRGIFGTQDIPGCKRP